MNRRDLLRGLAGSTLAGGLTVPSSTLAAIGGPVATALYREAVAKLPPKSGAEDTFLADVATAPLGREATDYVERAGPALALMVRGAAGSCNWGDYWVRDNFEHLSTVGFGLRRLGRLASLRVRIAIEGGRHHDGIADAIATLTMGRHLVQGGVLIVQLMGLAVEHVAVGAVAAPLPRLGRDELRTLAARFAALPAIPDPAATVRAERAWFLGDYAPNNPEEVDRAMIDRWSAWTARLADACADPAALAAIRAEAKPKSEEAQFLDTFDGYLQGRTYAEVKRSLLRAGIAVVEDGPGAVGRVVDPSDGKPFALRSWASGFELTSRFVLPRKPPTSLIVGSR